MCMCAGWSWVVQPPHPPTDSLSVTPISRACLPSGPCPPALSWGQWDPSPLQSWRDDPHPAPFPAELSGTLILRGLPIMGQLWQRIPNRVLISVQYGDGMDPTRSIDSLLGYVSMGVASSPLSTPLSPHTNWPV